MTGPKVLTSVVYVTRKQQHTILEYIPAINLFDPLLFVECVMTVSDELGLRLEIPAYWISIERSFSLVSVYIHMWGYRQRVEQVRTIERCLFSLILAVQFRLPHFLCTYTYHNIFMFKYYCPMTYVRCPRKKILHNCQRTEAEQIRHNLWKIHHNLWVESRFIY